MCGIVGVFGNGADELPAPDLSALDHRGPDARGVLRVRHEALAGWIGGVRLAITSAREPIAMPIIADDVVLAFIGEVYNWRTLREELGGPWRTDGDAEVLIAAWRRWGPAALDRLVGMFAFALLDLRDGVLHLARDRAGEKPLYYAVRGGHFHFASEIKAIGIPLYEGPCRDANVLEFDCLRDTPFAGVEAVLPGERLEIRARPDGEVDVRRETWWAPPAIPAAGTPVAPAAERLVDLVRTAVRSQVPAEVPFAVLVSGGLDSAVIQAVARAERVYCLTFPAEGLHPLDLAQEAARGAEVVPVTFDLADALKALDKIAWYLDTPATWPALGYWFLAERMAKDGVRVVLTGDGADELFGGYARYRTLWWLDRMRADPALARYGEVVDRVTGSGDAVLARLLDRGDPERAAELARLHGSAGSGDDLPGRAARLDWHTTMQVNLRMVDRMMMAHGIENRSPFLDVRVVETAFRLGGGAKITAGASKAVLREVARRLGVPRRIVEDRQKTGLAIPWNRWRGVPGWDRRDFADAMRAAWRRAFGLAAQKAQGAA